MNKKRQLAKLYRIKTMTIGIQLKKAREKKQISIDEAYQHTRILPEMLHALEEDNFARISEPIYIKSFLRKYSSYLGIDPEGILKEYNNLNTKKAPAAPEPTTDDEKAFTRTIDSEKIAKRLKAIFKYILIILLLILLMRTTGWAKRKFLNWRSARIELAEQVKQARQAEEQKPIQDKKIELTPKTIKKPVGEPLKDVLIPQDEKLTLSIKTTDDVWVELRRDSKIIFKNVLKKDSEENWQADEDFELWTGNAAAMDITLNGHNLGSPGIGVKKGIIINRQGMKK